MRSMPRTVSSSARDRDSAGSFTAVLHREDDVWVALCPEVDVASQGDTIEQAKAHLREAVELFLEHADEGELTQRLHTDSYVTRLEIGVG